MEKFIVSARKYRPQNFSTVVGQQHITITLKNAIRNNQLAHAFLFCGPRGVGKTTCARILAKTINCENRDAEGEACNKCISCVSFNDGASLNIHELDAASNNSVEDIRSLVDQVRFAPQAGKYKVYIIDEVHMLSSSAFNAFLKTLEEPPPYAIFILATTEKHKILPTILSRCQIFDFKRITLLDTVSHLQEICDKENIVVDKSALQVIAQKSEGCMRDALSILDKIASFTNNCITYQNTLEHLNILDADYYFKMLEAMHGQHLSDALLIYDDINKKGFEGDLVLNGFAEFLRNILVCQDDKSAELLEAVEGFRDKYREVSARVGTSYLISALNILNEAEINYRAARNKRLHVELTFIKLCYLQQAIEWVGDQETTPTKKSQEGKSPSIAFRKLVPLAAPLKNLKEIEPSLGLGTQRARLLIETANARKDKKEPSPVMQEIATVPVPTPAPQVEQAKVDAAPINATLGALSKLRREVAGRQQNTAETAVQNLTDQPLLMAWQEFTLRLRESRNPALQSFELAELHIKGEYLFEVIAHNNLELKFIEQEKRQLSAFLQNKFNNRAISFSVTIEEGNYQEPADRPLNKREQYQKIVEQYPLVKDLKDRLKLDLDY